MRPCAGSTQKSLLGVQHQRPWSDIMGVGNLKQRNRIVARRRCRLKIQSARVLHGFVSGSNKQVSRQEHAKRRQRGPQGRFVRADEGSTETKKHDSTMSEWPWSCSAFQAGAVQIPIQSASNLDRITTHPSPVMSCAMIQARYCSATPPLCNTSSAVRCILQQRPRLHKGHTGEPGQDLLNIRWPSQFMHAKQAMLESMYATSQMLARQQMEYRMLEHSEKVQSTGDQQ
jgi:hypothetical protein